MLDSGIRLGRGAKLAPAAPREVPTQTKAEAAAWGEAGGAGVRESTGTRGGIARDPREVGAGRDRIEETDSNDEQR